MTVDTTARAFLSTAHDAAALETAVTKALKSKRLRLKKISKSSLKAPAAIYDIDVKGLG